MLRALGIVAIACSAIQTGCRCDQERGSAAGQASASASATDVRAHRSTQATAPEGERLLLPRPQLGKDPPPQKPPPDAEGMELGVFYRQLARGKERTPTSTERLFADLKAWDDTGKLLNDTSARPEPLMFSPRSLPEPLRLKLAEQPIGSSFQLWLPPEATQGWKLMEWPNEGLVRVELHVIGAIGARSTMRTIEGRRPDGPPKFKPPASTGPPTNAKQGPHGLRYIWLESGPEGSQPEATSHVTVRLTGYRVEGVVVSEIVRDQRTEMDLAKAPKAVAHVVGKMVRGDSVRAWLEPALAKEVFPQAKSEVVVDVTLLDIN